MLTSERKGQIDRLWKGLRLKGLTGTVDLVEQVAHLLFLRLLGGRGPSGRGFADVLKERHVDIDVPKMPRGLLWGDLMAKPPSDRHEILAKRFYPWLQSLVRSHDGVKSMAMSARFLFPDGDALDLAMRQIDDIGDDADSNVLAEFYDYMMERMSKKGRLGVFKTPAHLAKLMVELARPVEEEIVCDPACGTGGLLMEAGNHVLEKVGKPDRNGTFWRWYTKSLLGCECNRAAASMAAVNMVLHHHDPAAIVFGDALAGVLRSRAGQCDVVMTALPFGGDAAVSIMRTDGDGQTKSRRRDVCFFDVILDLLRVGGRAVVLAPGSVLSAKTKQHRMLRRRLVVDNDLKSIVALPPGVFLPHTDAATAILVFEKQECTDDGGQSENDGQPRTRRVRFYACTGDGYSLSAGRKRLLPNEKMGCLPENGLSALETAVNNLPEILPYARYGGGRATPPSSRAFVVDVDRIEKSDFDLSVECYRPRGRRTPSGKSASELLAMVREDERRMAEDIRALERLLK